jgi:hypothetical protein
MYSELYPRIGGTSDYKALAKRVGPAGASERTAKLVQKYLRKSN